MCKSYPQGNDKKKSKKTEQKIGQGWAEAEGFEQKWENEIETAISAY